MDQGIGKPKDLTPFTKIMLKNMCKDMRYDNTLVEIIPTAYYKPYTLRLWYSHRFMITLSTELDIIIQIISPPMYLVIVTYRRTSIMIKKWSAICLPLMVRATDGTSLKISYGT